MRHLGSVRLIVVSIAADALIIGARAVCADNAPGTLPDRRVEAATIGPGPAEPIPSQAAAEEAEQRDGTDSRLSAVPPDGSVGPWRLAEGIREIQHSCAMNSDRWTQPVPVGGQP